MITHEILTRPQQAFFILLRAGIWNQNPEDDLFLDFSELEWKEVYRSSIEQGIMALVFDAVMRLPDELRPPRSLKVNWTLNVEFQEKNYARQEDVACVLAENFSKVDIRMFLFKGLSLAQFYPIPSHREFGDLDIYLFGKYKEGNRSLIRQGSAKKHSDPKHTSFYFRGNSIENHAFFISVHRYSHLKRLNDKLILLSEKSSNIIIPDKPLLPVPDFNALFIMTHILLHFPSSIVIRHLCDWAVFLEANKENIDFVNYKNTLSEAGLLKAADAFTSLTVRFLGLNPESAPLFNCDPALEDKILLNILNPLILQKQNPSLWDIVAFKYRMLKYRRWKYELINPDRYGVFILNSILFYLRHPGLIFVFKTKKNESSGNH